MQTERVMVAENDKIGGKRDCYQYCNGKIDSV